MTRGDDNDEEQEDFRRSLDLGPLDLRKRFYDYVLDVVTGILIAVSVVVGVVVVLALVEVGEAEGWLAVVGVIVGLAWGVWHTFRKLGMD